MAHPPEAQSALLETGASILVRGEVHHLPVLRIKISHMAKERKLRVMASEDGGKQSV